MPPNAEVQQNTPAQSRPPPRHAEETGAPRAANGTGSRGKRGMRSLFEKSSAKTFIQKQDIVHAVAKEMGGGGGKELRRDAFTM